MALAIAVPFDCPKQRTFVCDAIEDAIGPEGPEILTKTLGLNVHPF